MECQRCGRPEVQKYGFCVDCYANLRTQIGAALNAYTEIAPSVPEDSIEEDVLLDTLVLNLRWIFSWAYTQPETRD
jgi:hypothetical protein